MRRPKLNPPVKLSFRPTLRDALRFYHYTSKCGVSGCWYWQCKLNECGYGRIRVKIRGKLKSIGVHRFSYVLHKRGIPKDHQIDHKCHNRQCVNPAHLIAKHYLKHARESARKKRPKKRSLCEAL